MCKDAQGCKYMVKAFNSSDNFFKLEEVTSSPILFIQIECSNVYLEKRTLWFRVHLRKLFSSFNSVFSPSCISFVLKDTFEQEIFRNYCCGETGKSKALHFIKAWIHQTMKAWKNCYSHVKNIATFSRECLTFLSSWLPRWGNRVKIM